VTAVKASATIGVLTSACAAKLHRPDQRQLVSAGGLCFFRVVFPAGFELRLKRERAEPIGACVRKSPVCAAR
jgi:hypothetical protein